LLIGLLILAGNEGGIFRLRVRSGCKYPLWTILSPRCFIKRLLAQSWCLLIVQSVGLAGIVQNKAAGKKERFGAQFSKASFDIFLLFFPFIENIA
jgi:hypothetical protein